MRSIAQGSVAPESPATGFYARPTLIADVPMEAPLACDEVFGPVLAAMPFRDEADAIRLANGTEYGLVAGVWTENGGRDCAWPAPSEAARCSSTTMVRAAAWSCPWRRQIVWLWARKGL